MRELEFRVSHYTLDGFKAFTYFRIDKDSFLDEQGRGSYKNTVIKTIEQYIGRKDDNDTKIFEGDEVIIEGGENHQGCREYLVKGVTTYSVSGFYIVTKEGVHYSFADTPFDSIEIVGNIHEQN